MSIRPTFWPEAQQLSASTKNAWRDYLDPNGINVSLRPFMFLKIGHVNSVIATDHLKLAESDEWLLIKGRNYKVIHAEGYEERAVSW